MPLPSPGPVLHENIDLVEALDCMWIILALVAEWQLTHAEQNVLKKWKLSSSPSSSSLCLPFAFSNCGLTAIMAEISMKMMQP
jgi:hypothetical protein